MIETTPEISGSAALAEDMSFLLARASALSNAAGNAALFEFGFKVRSYAVLELAASESQVSQREIAEYLRLDPSQVVSLVDELEKDALVAREADPRDRRANAIIATVQGRERLTRARISLREAEAAVHFGLTAEERATLVLLLRKAAFPGLSS
ncbi:MarR family winged helix-turn-helix transcriptional regulator [Microbacterium sp. PMB16]|uniref:MarR family winged helix-turn-helix transcriptional regulator n=1 Tax=Microbacterium sp. PMB16 TaxID=3120157 RepID=UPI003F4B395E